jgi:hypothetical protein
MIAPMAASATDIYEAVVALSRSLAGRTDLRSLLEHNQVTSATAA